MQLPSLVRSALAVAFSFGVLSSAFGQDQSIPKFKAQEIDKSLKVGYGVYLEDLNEDGKKDIIVVDSARVIWFENPTWKLHTIIQGQTKADNVCAAAYDIDGDGHLDLALGAGWMGKNGNVQWLQRGKNIDEPWKLHPIGEIPFTHRMRWADLDNDRKAELIVAPLHNGASTGKNNWMEKGVPLTVYKIPADPTKDKWEAHVIDDTMHALHNFTFEHFDRDGLLDLYTASYEGVTFMHNQGKLQFKKHHIGEGNQANPKSNRGSSEIKIGVLKQAGQFIATVEPWHGFEVVVYRPGSNPLELWNRQVIDKDLKWGHAVWCADLDDDGGDELIVGVRDPLNDQFRSGVRIYTASPDGKQWTRHILDNGGVATEDLTCGDLNGDGKIDIVAVGRSTGNVKIYWNQGK